MSSPEASLFDKLFDETLQDSSAGPARKPLSAEAYRDLVVADVENLLNSRCAFTEQHLARYPQCQRSLASYGLRDIAAMSLGNSGDRHALCQMIERAIARHEPRLIDARVTMASRRGSGGGVHFSIQAMLGSSTAHAPISLEAVLQSSTLQYRIGPPRYTSGRGGIHG